MQNSRRSLSGAGGRVSQQVTGNARNGNRSSQTLRRAGSLLSSDQPSTPPNVAAVSPNAAAALSSINGNNLNTSGSTAASTGDVTGSGGQPITGAGGAEGSAAPATPPEESGSVVGLTPASLKHLRRQNAKLTEEKDRLVSELERAQALQRDLRERIAALEEQLQESAIREEKLQEELCETREREEAERNRADEADRRKVVLEESMVTKDAEIARLRKLLEDQLALTKEVCEAAERSSQGDTKAAASSAEEIARLNQQVKLLAQENDTLQKERKQQELEHVELQKRTGMAMAAAEKAMAMHATHLQRVEQLRVAKLADAIQHKVELHISVPRVTLSYNNAPPLNVSAASALGENRIKEFLEQEVFCQFEPLWVTLDSLDQAPDGTSKKAYSTRMLERLTAAVKGFVEKSQRSEPDGGLKPSVQEAITPTSGAVAGSPGAAGSGGSPGNQRAAARSSAETGPLYGNGAGAAGIGAALAGAARKPHAGAGGGCAMDSLADADRERLLGLLRSGDDRGLNSKLQELMQSQA